MPKLQIHHIPGSTPAAFHLLEDGSRLVGEDGRELPQMPVTAPGEVQVAKESSRTLSSELRWYLEDFLQYPFSPNDRRAERVMQALEEWGREAFAALFDRGDVPVLQQLKGGRELPDVEVVGNDPRVLSWPWEALVHPTLGFLAHHTRITRRLAAAPDAHPVPDGLPQDRVNILLVTARPKERDVPYRSISRPLVEMIAEEDLPAAVHVLRPPTLQQLRDHLEAHPDTYHVLHFDGHGNYGEEIPAYDRDEGSRRAGRLLFEREDGSAHEVSADDLSTILREHRVPAVVLNACQSGMVDERAEGPFASVAAGLLRAGVRSVVAMGYTLYISGAQRFLPDFYRRLFGEGDLAEAVRAGRQKMKVEPERLSAAGDADLDDWLVPVHYCQEAFHFNFADTAGSDGAEAHVVGEETADVELPEEGRDRGEPLYGFFGRDDAIQDIERAMRRPPAGILIQGLGGVGKTSLAWEVLSWLKHTGGLHHDPIWLNFDDVRNAEYALDRLGVPLYGDQFRTVTGEMEGDADAKRKTRLQQKVDLIAEAMKSTPLVVVWDNFESVAGIEGAGVEPKLDADDRQVLKDLLAKLRGGETTVIITSRSPEDWLGGPRVRYKLQLGGLRGEDRWKLTRAILTDLGQSRLQKDEALNELVNELGGHPLAMQALLPQLESTTPQSLLDNLRTELAALDTGDAQTDRLFATLRFVESSIPDDLHDLLIPLSMHERFVDANMLGEMCEVHGGAFDQSDVDRLLSILTTAGLVQPVGSNVYRIHPMLTSYLRETVSEQDEAWERAFIGFMAAFADHLAPKPLHEQRPQFFAHEGNFMMALDIVGEHTGEEEGESKGQLAEQGALLQSLAAYAQNNRHWDRARSLYERLLRLCKRCGDQEGVAGACHQLGTISLAQREWEEAEHWYKKSLEIKERQGNEHGAAKTYHQLGIVAQEQRDWEEAERWYRKSLEIKERMGSDHTAAQTYHQLGIAAQKRREWEEAEMWYRKSLEIKERQGNEHGAAKTYHQLGIVAQEQREWEEAERWYRKSLEIKERMGNEHSAAQTYHQLGIVAQKQRNWEGAERWYRKALEVFERLDSVHELGATYHQLGRLAHSRRDFETAEEWYRKSLDVSKRQNNWRRTVQITKQLATIARQKENWESAERWYHFALEIERQMGDYQGMAQTYYELSGVAESKGDNAKSEDWMSRSHQAANRANLKRRRRGESAWSANLFENQEATSLEDTDEGWTQAKQLIESSHKEGEVNL